MASYSEKITEILECPCCYKIPRDIPVRSCQSGHIICSSCEKQVGSCPTCRQPLDCTNTIASKIASISEHKCQFEIFGCQVQNLFDDIVKHEKVCVERIVMCPFQECLRDVQLKKYENHALQGLGECAIDLDRAQGNFSKPL